MKKGALWPPGYKCFAQSVETNVFKIDRLTVNPHHRRCNPVGKFTRVHHAAHQATNKCAVVSGRKPVVNIGFPFGFATSLWVFNASEPTIEPHASHALLVTAQTQANIVGCSCTCFSCKIGVGYLSAHHSDEIAVAIGQCTLCLKRVFEATNSNDGQVDCFCEWLRE